MRIIKHIEDHAILGIKRIKTVSDILDQDVRPTSTGQILQYNINNYLRCNNTSVKTLPVDFCNLEIHIIHN
jgi:hypothetical protein